MSVSVPGLEQSSPLAMPAKQARGAWGAHGKLQERLRLRLLGALRGDGALVWAGGVVGVAYELDLFGRGEAQVADGNLEGDFSALIPAAPDKLAMPIPMRLRLDDGFELEIALMGLDAATGDFDAHGAAVGAYMLSRLTGDGPVIDRQSARWI